MYYVSFSKTGKRVQRRNLINIVSFFLFLFLSCSAAANKSLNKSRQIKRTRWFVEVFPCVENFYNTIIQLFLLVVDYLRELSKDWQMKLLY